MTEESAVSVFVDGGKLTYLVERRDFAGKWHNVCTCTEAIEAIRIADAIKETSDESYGHDTVRCPPPVGCA